MCPGNCHDYSTMAAGIGCRRSVWWADDSACRLLTADNTEKGRGRRRELRVGRLPGLVCLNRLRQLERYAALVVLFASGLEVQIPDCEFVTVSGREVEQRLAEDGVIRDLQRASVFENQKRRRQRRIRLDGGSLFPCTFGGVRGRSIFRWSYV